MLPLPTYDQVNLLVVAGLRSWANDPWQDWLDAQFRDAQWVRPVDGEWPDPEVWSKRIERMLDRMSDRSCLVIAHGFGALAAVWHANRGISKPAGMLLFAPADPKRFAIEQTVLDAALPCPASLVASTREAPDNYPWLHGPTARRWAATLNARFIDAEDGPGAKDLPLWPLGQRVLERHVDLFQQSATTATGAGASLLPIV